MSFNRSRTQKKDPSQKEQERHQKMLEQILRLPGNDNCADCGQKGPRWASVNLGIFVCIRCSGIHRNMGTHISKVKSVSLDKWQPENIEQVRRIGNANARRIYEGRLPSNYHKPRDSDAYAIEQWIRDKYDRKKWYDSDAAAEVVSGGKLSATNSPAPEKSKSQRSSSQRNSSAQKKAPTAALPVVTNPVSSVDDFFGSFETQTQPQAQAQPTQAPVPTQAKAQQPTTPDDFFAAFQTPSQTAANTNSVNDFFSSSASAGFQSPAQQENKKDAIMSLFKSPAPMGNQGYNMNQGGNQGYNMGNQGFMGNQGTNQGFMPQGNQGYNMGQTGNMGNQGYNMGQTSNQGNQGYNMGNQGFMGNQGTNQGYNQQGQMGGWTTSGSGYNANGFGNW